MSEEKLKTLEDRVNSLKEEKIRTEEKLKNLREQKDKIIADTIVSVLNTQVSNESKIRTLVFSIGMSEDEAKEIVGTETINDDTE